MKLHDGNQPRIARRTALACVAGGIAGLAGCTTSSETPDEPNEDQPESETFDSVDWDGPTLCATLATDVSATYVDLVDPNGETLRRDHPQDTADVSFTLLGETEDGYEPGKYRLVASDGDSAIGETTVSLDPEFTITDVKWAAEHPDLEWDKDQSDWEDRAAIEIENTGTAPSYVEQIRWTDAPLSKVMYPAETEFYHRVLLPAGETTTIYGAAVYATDGRFGESIDCSEIETDELTATAIVQAGENPSYSQTVEYGETEGSCDLSIVDGVPVESTAGGE
ncbi:hypothetical protein Halru_2812 [Halovivax ruber XH-70]|uniref:Uncharacterized protein n=1 Tax=Halovivax ruber (strain DSM 18193 / JCM 13892 / XH-70) TaxID=797302 RepID=L0IEX6_HALRX|nr:hypothetical protein [Halovivax ruber]AGB17383.1 hypothetical protein Halru_2812 [Halovivax ruber XH-70]